MSGSKRRVPPAPDLSKGQLSIPQVTGAVHGVGVDQLFFSTTGARGVIRRSNNVFIELSRYRCDKLSGTPHNIIRHPEMPGGAFKAMWNTFKAGSPLAVYIRNLVADGNEYGVFATVTPLSDGSYLSVRTRPVCSGLFDTTCAVYRDARAIEDQTIDSGANCRAAVERGLDRIAEMLAGTGLSSYEEFQNTALPAEVTRREELSGDIPMHPDAARDLHVMLDSVTRIAVGLDSWMPGQQRLAELSTLLKAAGKGLTRILEDPHLSVERIAAPDRSDPKIKPLADLLGLWAQMQVLVNPLVAKLVDTLAQFDTNGARTRFRIILAHLHTTITSLFTVELIDGVEGSQYSAQAIPDLIKSLREGIAEMERQAQAHCILMTRAVAYIDEANHMMTVPNQPLMLQTGSAASNDPELSAIAAELSSATSGMVESVGRRLAELGDLAARCQTAHVADNFTELGEALDSFTTTAGAVAPS